MSRPSARLLRRTGLGFVLGVLGGWVAGLLRVRPEPRHGAAPGAHAAGGRG